jgi:hypothetical protein
VCVLLWWRCVPRWRSRTSLLILLGIAPASYAQNPSPWHGRIIGIEDTYGPRGLIQNLTYTDLENVSQRGVLTADSQLNYLLDAASATVYVYRRSISGEGENRSLEIIPLDNMAARKVVGYPPVCYACPACRGCTPDQAQIAISTDGRYVFTIMYRFLAPLKPSPPQIPMTDDSAVVKEVALPYDRVAGQFLDTYVFPVQQGGWLLPSSEPDSFELFSDGRLVRYHVGGRQVIEGAVVGEVAFPAGRYYPTRDTANARSLFLFENGKVIEAAGHLKDIGNIDPLPASRRRYSASVSGNGKLLFGPTGPANWAAGKFAPGPYIDQIDVYDAMTLARLRSLHSQRPLLDVIPNQDGGRLYAAIPGRPSIVVLNSNTLWQEEEHLTQLPIRQIMLLP